MKKKDVIDLKITDRLFPRQGIGYIDGEKVTVKDTLPGQTVSAQITKKRKGHFEGRLLQILHPADYESDAPCNAFGVCGGCNYQTISIEEENRLKEKQVLKLLDFLDPGLYKGLAHTEPYLPYRNKMEFSFGDTGKDGALALGIRKRGSFYEVVPPVECNLVDKDFIAIVGAVTKFFQATGETFYHRKTKQGTLRHLVVRKGYYTGEILVHLVTTSAIALDGRSFVDMLLNLKLDGTFAGILHSTNDTVADVVQSDTMDVLYGRDYYVDECLGLSFNISVYSFFQTNTKGAETLYTMVKNCIGELQNKVVFDLYCGTGTIAQMIAPHAKEVYGVEINEGAIQAAEENAKRNSIGNCRFIAGDVLHVVDTLEIRPDLIVVDPPRDGIHPKAIHKIIGFGAPELVYVSCKPTSLARDLKIFMENGYQVQQFKLKNMFPRTVHVETVILLQKKNC